MGFLSARALPEAIGTPIRLMVWTCRTSVKTGSGWAQGCQSKGTPRGRSRQEEEGGRRLRSSPAARWPGLRGTRGRGEGHGGLETLIHPAGFPDRQGALGEVRELGGHFGRRPRSRLHSQGREDSGLGYRGRSRGRPPARLEQGLAAKAGQPSASTSRRAHFSEPAQDPSPSHPASRWSAFPQGAAACRPELISPPALGWLGKPVAATFSGLLRRGWDLSPRTAADARSERGSDAGSGRCVERGLCGLLLRMRKEKRPRLPRLARGPGRSWDGEGVLSFLDRICMVP